MDHQDFNLNPVAHNSVDQSHLEIKKKLESNHLKYGYIFYALFIFFHSFIFFIEKFMYQPIN